MPRVHVAAPRALITSYPFGEHGSEPLDRLRAAGIAVALNPHRRTLREDELAGLIRDIDVLIAGTEPITPPVLDAAARLRLVARVGVGLDNIDVGGARARGIEVSYTPEAPAPAVAELTIGLMLALLRHVAEADRAVRANRWHRFMGRRLNGLTIGILGIGRVGRRVATIVRQGFPDAAVIANDIEPDLEFGRRIGLRWVDKDALFQEADVITVHVPLTAATRGLIGRRELAMMKRRALVINTARGSLVDEAALAAALRQGQLEGAALDVYDVEPYTGELREIDRALLTCHMGSMSEDCRAQMELEAVEDVVRFVRGEPVRQPAPEGIW